MTFGLTHIALAGALMACLAGIGGYFHGMTVGAAQEIASRKRADEAAETVRRDLQGQIDQSAEQFQANEYGRQQNVREIYHESQKIIERPVYSAVCIDADGVRLLDHAVATANGENIRDTLGPAATAAQGPKE